MLELLIYSNLQIDINEIKIDILVHIFFKKFHFFLNYILIF